MFRFLSGIPRRLKNILSHFKKHLTKPQHNNLYRTELTIISAAKKEHNITSLNERSIDKKPKQPKPIHHKPKKDNKTLLNQTKKFTPTRSHQTTALPLTPSLHKTALHR